LSCVDQSKPGSGAVGVAAGTLRSVLPGLASAAPACLVALGANWALAGAGGAGALLLDDVLDHDF